MQPSSRPRIELDVQGLCLQADAFRSGAPRIRRSVLTVRHAELRDCAPRPEGGHGWRKIVCYHATPNVPRDALARLLQVLLLYSKQATWHSEPLSLFQSVLERVACTSNPVRFVSDICGQTQRDFERTRKSTKAPQLRVRACKVPSRLRGLWVMQAG